MSNINTETTASRLITWCVLLLSVACSQCSDRKKTETFFPDLGTPKADMQPVSDMTGLKQNERDSNITVNADETHQKSFHPGMQLFGTVASNLLEFQMVSNDARFLVYKAKKGDKIKAYSDTGSGMREYNDNVVIGRVLDWVKSIKIIEKIEYDEDSFDDFFYGSSPSYVLIRTISSEQPFLFVLGKRAKNGNYYINAFDGQAFQIDGKLFDLLTTKQKTKE